MRKVFKITLTCLFAALIVIQFIPANRPTNNPPEGYDFFKANEVPAEIETMLRNTCYDCHSQETNYPWYAHVAPVSWLLAKDVREGRHHLDFSNWGSLNLLKQMDALDDISDEVELGDMPMPIYIPLHPSARLSDADRDKIVTWADDLAERLFEEK
jgi:hypothetical protein